MPRYVALFRGINVGKAKRVAMGDLRALLDKLGYTDIATLLNSGNAVFTGNADLFGLVPFGVAGMINPPTSFVPELCVELFNALDRKDYDEAVKAQKRVDTAARIVAARLRKYGRVPLQEVFRMRGFAVKRFPKWETEQMPKEEIAKLERELRKAGILGQ